MPYTSTSTENYTKYGTSGVSNTALQGGWIETEGYWTRSAIANGSS
jgi:hypothetical protein